MASLEVVPGFLDPSICAQLVEGFRRRNDLTATFDDTALKHFDGRVLWTNRLRPYLRNLAQEAADRCSRVIESRLAGFPVTDDCPQIVRWHPPHEMPPHTDLDNGRRFVAHVALSDEFAGGAITFLGLGRTIIPRLGTLVAFDGGMLNALEQITSGEMFLLSMWFHRAD
jgi:hypothetical protein